MTKLDDQQRKEREEFLRQATARLKALLAQHRQDAAKRLLAVPDDVWSKAQGEQDAGA